MSRPTVDTIKGKKCYWGRHTIEATASGGLIRLDIYENCPKKFLCTRTISATRRSLIDLANELPNDILGSLDTNHQHVTAKANGNKYPLFVHGITEPKIDYFVKSFKYPLEVSN